MLNLGLITDSAEVLIFNKIQLWKGTEHVLLWQQLISSENPFSNNYTENSITYIYNKIGKPLIR